MTIAGWSTQWSLQPVNEWSGPEWSEPQGALHAAMVWTGPEMRCTLGWAGPARAARVLGGHPAGCRVRLATASLPATCYTAMIAHTAEPVFGCLRGAYHCTAGAKPKPGCRLGAPPPPQPSTNTDQYKVGKEHAPVGCGRLTLNSWCLR